MLRGGKALFILEVVCRNRPSDDIERVLEYRRRTARHGRMPHWHWAARCAIRGEAVQALRRSVEVILTTAVFLEANGGVLGQKARLSLWSYLTID